jgi:hypothetical protein
MRVTRVHLRAAWQTSRMSAMTPEDRARQWLVTNLGMARDEWIKSLAEELRAVATCDHDWSGPGIETDNTSAATCSKCGLDAISYTQSKE